MADYLTSIAGYIVCEKQDVEGYYTDYHLSEEESERLKNPRGIIDPFYWANVELWLLKNKTFYFYNDRTYREKNYETAITGTWERLGNSIILQGRPVQTKTLAGLEDFHGCYKRTVFKTDTLIFNIVDAEQISENNDNLLKLFEIKKSTKGLPSYQPAPKLIWTKDSETILRLKNYIVTCDSINFQREYKKSKLKKPELNEIFIRYAIAVRQPAMLQYLINHGYIFDSTSKSWYEKNKFLSHPYYYALRCIKYPNKYDPEIPDRTDLPKREQQILDITAVWPKQILSSKDKEEFLTELEEWQSWETKYPTSGDPHFHQLLYR